MVRVVPHPSEKIQPESFWAAGRLDGTASIDDPSAENSEDAGQPGKIEDDHGVCAGEPYVERASVVPVSDPCVTGEKALLCDTPTVSSGFDPTRLPVMLVEVDDRESSPLPQARAKVDFPAPPDPTTAILCIMDVGRYLCVGYR